MSVNLQPYTNIHLPMNGSDMYSANVFDYSGNNNHGVMNASEPSYPSDLFTTAKVGPGAYRFAYTVDWQCISLGDTALVRLGLRSAMMSFWFKESAANMTNGGKILYKGSDFQISTEGAAPPLYMVFRFGWGDLVARNIAEWATGAWVWICVIKDVENSRGQIYKNNELIVDTAGIYNQDIDYAGSNLVIAAQTIAGADYNKFHMDDFRLMEFKAPSVTSQAIRDYIYNSGSGIELLGKKSCMLRVR